MNIENIKRIVFKLGTNVLRDENGEFSKTRIGAFINKMAMLHSQGKDIIIITSGAVGLGLKKLNLQSTDTVSIKQACAAIGQVQLMYIYQELFQQHNITTAQILLNEEDFSERKKYLNLNNTLTTLLELRAIPIINQNDTVSIQDIENYQDGVEICFSDNDKLSALVTSKLKADLLVILSDVDGLFEDNPKSNPNAKKIDVVNKITPEIESLAKGASKGGRGGMKTKLEAAKIVSRSGSHLIIANGKNPHILDDIFQKDNVGTLFLPSENLSGKKRWIAYATSVFGQLVVNNGAKKAILEKNSSLLPIGILDVKNDFKKGDVVGIFDENGVEFAKGISNYNASDCKKIKGHYSENIINILGYKNYDAIVTRDNIVIL